MNNLIWIDTELTNLDFSSNKIVEIAVLMTDSDLNILDEGLDLIIFQNNDVLDNMDPWCVEQFSKTGLLDEIKKSKINTEMAEKMILNYLKKWTKKGESPICGNSIGQDRKTLMREMPILEQQWLHYRSIDVSSLKELILRWRPNIMKRVQKKKSHRAMDDIIESIDELKLYRKYIFNQN